jgi:putative polyketide hydroxylase
MLNGGTPPIAAPARLWAVGARRSASGKEQHMAIAHVPVLIVGAGAGGLTTSAVLAQHGISSLLVEKRREVFVYPKARNLSFRSLEILRGLGLDDEVHAVAEGVSDMVVKPTLNSAEQKQALDIDAIFAGFDELSPEPSVQYCPQSRLEPILIDYTRRLGNEVRYGTELASFEQDESGVTAVLHDVNSGRDQTVRADYLVAADGVHGRTREAIGVSASGHGALPIFVVFIYFRAPWRRFVPGLHDGDAVQVKNAEVDGIFLAPDADFGMFITTYLPKRGESAAQFTPQRSRDLIEKAVGEPVDVQIIEVTPWQPHELVADEFRRGRVFLTGDAAHTMPPLKAGGANTAIQSAHNLAWKLAASLEGAAGPQLLATYHTERHPVGRFNARQSLTGPTLAMLTVDDNVPTLLPDEEAPMFGLLVGYRYRSTAVVTAEPKSADPDAVQLVDELRAQPGTRVPHTWVRRDGHRVSTLDLLGPRFTLFTGDDGARWQQAAAKASAALHVPITVHTIGTDGDIVDLDGRWAAASGLPRDGALLVRPDDFVGWRADTAGPDPAAGLCQALSMILGR